jgi:protein-disulfide isomerase
MSISNLTRAFALALLIGIAACGPKGEATDTATAKPVAAGAAMRVADVPNRDWTQVVVATPEGGFRMGNPNAKVKFLEYASLTCPHCRDFNKESSSAIRAYVATGKMSYEFRNFILNGPDYAVTMLARCQQPPAFFKTIDALYATQEQWIQPFFKAAPDAEAKLKVAPDTDKLLVIADSGNIADFFKLRGMSRARYESCLRDEAGRKKIADMAQVAQSKYNLQGTPTFVINDETKPDLHTWPDVDKAIRAMMG